MTQNWIPQLGSSLAIVNHPQLQPTPSPEPETQNWIPQLGSSPAIVASATSTTSLGKSMSPVVVLHRSTVLDALNDARNFQEIEKKMEEIHS